MEISRLATGQPTPSLSEDGCDPCCSRLPHNGQPRMKKLSNAATPVAGQHRLPPVRVALLRADAYAEQTGPPDGESKDWWSRLNKALGTVSTDFVRASARFGARGFECEFVMNSKKEKPPGAADRVALRNHPTLSRVEPTRHNGLYGGASCPMGPLFSSPLFWSSLVVSSIGYRRYAAITRIRSVTERRSRSPHFPTGNERRLSRFSTCETKLMA